jgi:DNA-binding LytR/AlgR family response regulator
MALKVLIVEDELIVAEDLKSMLQSYGYENSGIAYNYTEAIDVLDKSGVDVALLDINLGGNKTGVDVAKYIREKFQIPIIFISSNSDPISVKATKEVKPNGYLVKPFRKEDIFTAIETALVNFGSNDSISKPDVDPDYLFVKQNDLFHKIKIDDILYLMSDKNYTEVHTESKRFVVRGSIKSVAENLDPTKFLRTHRSYVVNFDKIDAINSAYIVINDVKIPMGVSYRSSLLEKAKFMK